MIIIGITPEICRSSCADIVYFMFNFICCTAEHYCPLQDRVPVDFLTHLKRDMSVSDITVFN